MVWSFCFEFWTFEFCICFGFRYSNFGFISLKLVTFVPGKKRPVILAAKLHGAAYGRSQKNWNHRLHWLHWLIKKIRRKFLSQKHCYKLVSSCMPKYSCQKNKKLTDSITARPPAAAKEDEKYSPSGKSLKRSGFPHFLFFIFHL